MFYQRLLRLLAFLFFVRVQCLVDMTENMPVREQVDNEQGIVSFFIQISPSSEKMTFTFAFWQGFKGPDGINYMAKTALI